MSGRNESDNAALSFTPASLAHDGGNLVQTTAALRAGCAGSLARSSERNASASNGGYGAGRLVQRPNARRQDCKTQGRADSERPSGTAEYFSQDHIQSSQGRTHPEFPRWVCSTL